MMNGWRSAAGAILVCGVSALTGSCRTRTFAADSSIRGRGDLLAQLHVPRRIEPRLSVETTYAPCHLIIESDTTIASSRCRDPKTDHTPPAYVLALATRAAAVIQSNTSADAFHTAALIDLIWGDSGKSLDQSISYLRAAAKLETNSASTLADLSAALLVRAGGTQDSGDLVDAMEQADRALDIEPHNLTARFNLALALGRLNLASESDSAWTAYAGADASSPWANEARHTRRYPILAKLVSPLPNASRTDIATYVARMPQNARELGWDQALGDWATAWLQHDSATAREHLQFAATMAAALKVQGRDETLANAVRSVQNAHHNRRALDSLAVAHQAYARGRALYIAGNYPASSRLFTLAVARSTRSQSLSRWARLHLAATLVYAGKVDRGERILRNVISIADTARAPALAARAHWMLGTTLLRTGRYESARDAFQSAQTLFERAGERANTGAVELLAARAQFALGDDADAVGTMRHGLAMLHPYSGSVWVHDILMGAATAALTDGLPRAALRFENEDVVTTTSAQSPIYAVEARLARARLFIARGDSTRALSDVSRARRSIRAIPISFARSWATAELQYDDALASYHGHPARAIATLDSVAGFFDSLHNVARVLPVLVSRADAYLARGDLADATADLDRSSTLLAAEGNDVRSASFRASLLDAARPVFDRLVLLQADAGRSADALAALERGRAFVAPSSSTMSVRNDAHMNSAFNEAAVEYALIGDTLLTWTIHRADIRMRRTTLSRQIFFRTIDQTQTALATQISDTSARRSLEALYNWLVRPIEADLSETGVPLVVITDGEIARVPFVALFDRQTKKYLIESHPLRFAASLRDARSTPHTFRGHVQRALIVGNPAFDRRAFPSLDQLPGAAVEASAIGKVYRNATTLSGGAATVAAVEAALPDAEVVHYAGHAIVDDAYPDRSFLVLSPGSRHASGADELSASQVRRLNLHRVRLIVLSACETLRPRDGRSGGLAGLSAAFIAAGAGGVLGSQWRADDRTSGTLMEDFHAAYHRTGDGAGALRTAQVHMIRSSNPALRSPSAWAGYRYAGQ